MEVCTKWWVRRCLKCQARKISCQTIRWPTLSVPLPNNPGVSASVDYFGPLPTTARGNSYILLFTDRFSRRADMFAVTAAEFTAEGTANISVNRFIPVWGCPPTLLSDNDLQFCAQLAAVVYKLLGVQKLTTSAYHPSLVVEGRRTRTPHHGANAGHGLQRTLKRLGMYTSLTLNTPTTTLSAPRQVSLLTKCIRYAYRASPPPLSISPTAEPTRALTATISPIAITPVNDNNEPTSSCANNTPSHLRCLN